ncbi:sn-glycerol-1-phosphate dehydrogenase [Salibacterium aidingense]|uniref:sn-glycerol-1-phosphate dehydrogenase n=1 Tax=Salibacterium aidingense TaxID=384933 RepID=UPI003BC1D79C
MLETELRNISDNCMNGRPVPVEHIEIEKNSLSHIPMFIEEKQYRRVFLIVDHNTKTAAGEMLKELLNTGGIETEFILLPEDQHGQVKADEETVMEVFIQVPSAAECLIAVGSGTIHDITRFVSGKMKIPFISVPTAASVDGFTSMGAPLIIKGTKKTFQVSCPIAVFADIDVLQQAPPALTGAGVGDIAAKFTSLFDWELSRLIGGEPYNSWARYMMEDTLYSVKNHIGRIAKRDEEGIKRLMEGLIQSGLVMMALDYSRPASGAEHHLSHYWEMALLQQEEKQLLHGAKVGVATGIICDLYNYYFKQPHKLQLKNEPEWQKRWEENEETIKRQISLLPSSKEITDWLQLFGAPVTTTELGLSDELVKESLNNAHYLRDRCTGLKLIHLSRKQILRYPFE